MIRRMWLQNPETKEIWDLLPVNPHDASQQGCALLTIKGFGYQQNVTQEQVEIDYFISAISSANKPATGILHFNGDKHLEAFQAYIGDFRKQFNLYYSPSGEYEPYDILSAAFYKPVVITQVEKTEKDEFGWYDCSATFVPQADVWKRTVYYSMGTPNINVVGEALVYPYTYEKGADIANQEEGGYVYGGRDLYAIDIQNRGRETGCVVKITNTGTSPISQLEWFIEHTPNGQKEPEIQRSRWYFLRDKNSADSSVEVMLQGGQSLYVDSNATTQEAKVIYPQEGGAISEMSVVNWQEPSWDYINFVRIKNGQNRIVFYIEGTVQIEVIYQEQKELI